MWGLCSGSQLSWISYREQKGDLEIPRTLRSKGKKKKRQPKNLLLFFFKMPLSKLRAQLSSVKLSPLLISSHWGDGKSAVVLGFSHQRDYSKGRSFHFHHSVPPRREFVPMFGCFIPSHDLIIPAWMTTTQPPPRPEKQSQAVLLAQSDWNSNTAQECFGFFFCLLQRTSALRLWNVKCCFLVLDEPKCRHRGINTGSW